MNLFSQLREAFWTAPKQAVRKASFSVIASWLSYLGAQRYSPDRSYIHGWVQDARFDADQVSRWELIRKSRAFERNNAILNRLADLFEQFTVGADGLQILPDSTDDVWNDAAQDWWNEWESVCDLTSLCTFGTLQSLAARSWFIDGEIFILKTRGDVAPFRPRIQLIETHRVETPPGLLSEEGKTIIDGIEIDSKGRPTAYWIRDGLDMQVHRRFPADSIIHIFEPSRPGQMRGLPFCYPIINTLIDLEDLQNLEMRAAKDAAEKSTFFFTENGELPRDTMRLQTVNTRQKTSDGTEIIEKRLEAMKKAIGGRAVGMKKGEDAKQFVPSRPSAATAEYWDYLTASACAGIGIPKILVFPKSIQGTVARAELDIAAGFFRCRSAVLAEAFRRVYVYVMSWAVTYDPRLDGAPEDGSWKQCTTRPPRAPNVDVGRNSAAMIAEVDAGLKTFEQAYGELGMDWKREFKQRAKEAAYIKALATKFGVDENDIAERLPIKQPGMGNGTTSQSGGGGGGGGGGSNATGSLDTARILAAIEDLEGLLAA